MWVSSTIVPSFIYSFISDLFRIDCLPNSKEITHSLINHFVFFKTIQSYLSKSVILTDPGLNQMHSGLELQGFLFFIFYSYGGMKQWSFAKHEAWQLSATELKTLAEDLRH